jgi:hypothetical protein
MARPAGSVRQLEDRLRASPALLGRRHRGRILHAVQAEADLAGKLDWTMVGVDSTMCRAHQHAAGARKTTPRVPKKGPRLGTTVQTRGSVGPGAA